MSGHKQQLTPTQRLAALSEEALAEAERRTAAGESVSARELNGLRRLIVALEGDEQLERANALARGY